jgi:hypothetical protein
MDVAREQRLFQLFGKNSFAANFRQGMVKHLITGGIDDVFMTFKPRMPGLKELDHTRSLPARESRGPGSED